MSDVINLEKYCDPERAYIARPFSAGKWTYATNGYIMVRVPRRDDVAENPASPVKGAKQLFRRAQRKVSYTTAPNFELSEPFEWEEQVDCFPCGGTGRKQHCLSCQCECEGCDGTGKIAHFQFSRAVIGAVPYNAKYISWLQSLPKLEIGSPHAQEPLPFRFHGGEGLLVPCKL